MMCLPDQTVSALLASQAAEVGRRRRKQDGVLEDYKYNKTRRWEVQR